MPETIDLRYELYKKLIEIRLLMDENLPKAKQIMTNLIKNMEDILKEAKQ